MTIINKDIQSSMKIGNMKFGRKFNQKPDDKEYEKLCCEVVMRIKNNEQGNMQKLESEKDRPPQVKIKK